MGKGSAWACVLPSCRPSRAPDRQISSELDSTVIIYLTVLAAYTRLLLESRDQRLGKSGSVNVVPVIHVSEIHPQLSGSGHTPRRGGTLRHSLRMGEHQLAISSDSVGDAELHGVLRLHLRFPLSAPVLQIRISAFPEEPVAERRAALCARLAANDCGPGSHPAWGL